MTDPFPLTNTERRFQVLMTTEDLMNHAMQRLAIWHFRSVTTDVPEQPIFKIEFWALGAELRKRGYY